MATIEIETKSPRSFDDSRLVKMLGTVGIGVLRYGLVFLLLLWGAFKFTAVEAEGIRPLVENSPYLHWLYGFLGFREVSELFGIVEMTTGVLIATRRWLPRVSGYASLGAAVMFVVTLSFLFTTPGALALTSPVNGFLLKDILLLGAALLTASEALSAAGSQVERSPRMRVDLAPAGSQAQMKMGYDERLG